MLVFHGFPSFIHGGFVGVDIFFVISGFLISKHIWEELGSGKFSIKTFYARRVKRIFPALSLVLLSCLLMGWVILTPGEYEQLGRHVLAGTAFVSNLLFWKEAGYFDNAADTKPLLHLWSLGIEEQFYIVWPLFLAFFWRYSRHLGWAFLGVMGVSLSYSVMVSHHDVVADFYSPFTRFWELALGAALAHSALIKPHLDSIYRSLISWLGLFLIVASVIMIQKDYLFPGLWALLPTLGAACIIFAGEDAWLNRKLLSLRLIVWFGLISYPLYLWHWPLLTFARIMESGTPSVLVRLFLLATSIFLAWLTYQFVERPIRSKPRSKSLILIMSLCMLLLGTSGFIVKNYHGVKSRQFSLLNGESGTIVLGADRDKLQHECYIAEPQKSLFQYCLQSPGKGDPNYLLIGDSKGEALFYGLVRESKPDMHWMMIGTVYPPEGDIASKDTQQIKNQLALETIANNPQFRVVVLTVAMRGIFTVDGESGFIAPDAVPPPQKLASYSRAIQRIEQAGKQVVFVADNPTFPDPTSCVSGGLTASTFLNQFLRRAENKYCSIRYTDYLAGTRAYWLFIEELRRLHPGMAVYDPTPLLCDIPHNVCTITREGKFLYSYGDHISDYANSLIARDMLPFINKLMP